MVLEAAELRTPARPGAGPRDVDVDGVVDALDHVPLHEQLGDPEAVVHIGGVELEAHRCADGHHQLGRVDPVAVDHHPLLGVPELPRPLEAGDLHDHIGVIRQGDDPLLGGDREAEQHGHDDEGDRGVEHLDRDVLR